MGGNPKAEDRQQKKYGIQILPVQERWVRKDLTVTGPLTVCTVINVNRAGPLSVF